VEDRRESRSPSPALSSSGETISPLARPRPPRFPVPRSSVTLSPTVRTVPGPPSPDGPAGQRMAATRARALQQQREQRGRGGRGGSPSTAAASAAAAAARNNAVPFPFPPTTTAAALQSSFRSPEDNDFYYSPSSLSSPPAAWSGGEEEEEEEDGGEGQPRRGQRRRRRRQGTGPRAAPPPPPPPPRPPLAPLAAALRGLLASRAGPRAAPPLALARAAWLSLPFALRRLSWQLFGPPPLPPFHASPRAAALRAAVAAGGDADGGRALRALARARAVGRDGRAADAGADVPRHRLEALVGRGLRRGAAARVREALTLPSALPRRAGPRGAAAGSGSGSGSSGSSSGSGSSGDDDDGGGEERAPPAAASADAPAPAPSALPAPRPPQFERLEFLGDAVLELAAREWSLRRFPRATEHGLSNSARSLVCGRSLLAAAAAARLDVFVTSNARTMARSEYLTHWAGAGGLASLVDAVEAVAGALYLEFGLGVASEWVLRLALGVSVAADDDDEGDDGGDERGRARGATRGRRRTDGEGELEREREHSDDSAFDDDDYAFDDDDGDSDAKGHELASSPPPPLPPSPPRSGGAGGGGTRLLLDNNYKSLLAIVAGHAAVEYRGSHVLCERGWGGHSPGHPATKGSAALPALAAAADVAGGEGGGEEGSPPPRAAAAAAGPEGGGPSRRPRSRAAWLWVSRVSVGGRLRGVGADVHRPTAEQAAARQALAGAGVDADALWRERLADQM